MEEHLLFEHIFKYNLYLQHLANIKYNFHLSITFYTI